MKKRQLELVREWEEDEELVKRFDANPKLDLADILWQDGQGNHLIEYSFNEEMCDLISRCVEHVVPKLVNHPKIKIFGKDGVQHRNVGFFSTNPLIHYGYSGFHCETQPAPRCIESLLEEINYFFPGANYNAILVNEYTSGEDYISDHSDDEKSLSPEAGVLTISFGSPREFQIKSKKDKKKVLYSVPTRSLRMLQMYGPTFQQQYLHGIPPVRKGLGTGTRISLTFRSHKIGK